MVTLIRLRATRRCLNYLIAAFVLCHLLGSDFPHLLRVPRPTDPICILIISERACAVGVGVQNVPYYTTCIKEGRPSDLSYYSSMRRVRTLLGLAIGDLELFSNYLNNEIME